MRPRRAGAEDVSSPTQTRGSGRPTPMTLSLSCTSATLSRSTHRSSEPASPAGAARATGTAAIEDGPSLSLSAGERDTAPDLAAVLNGHLANPQRYAVRALEMDYRARSRAQTDNGEH